MRSLTALFATAPSKGSLMSHPAGRGPVPLSREVERRVAWIAARRDIEQNLLKSVVQHQAVGFGL